MKISHVFRVLAFAFSLFLLIACQDSEHKEVDRVKNGAVQKDTAVTAGNAKEIDRVKNGTIQEDTTITVGNAFDKYKFFESTSWNQTEFDQGRKGVVVVGILRLSDYVGTNIDLRDYIYEGVRLSKYPFLDYIKGSFTSNNVEEIEIKYQQNFILSAADQSFVVGESKLVLTHSDSQLVITDETSEVSSIYENQKIDIFNSTFSEWMIGSFCSEDVKKFKKGKVVDDLIQDTELAYLADRQDNKDLNDQLDKRVAELRSSSSSYKGSEDYELIFMSLSENAISSLVSTINNSDANTFTRIHAARLLNWIARSHAEGGNNTKLIEENSDLRDKMSSSYKVIYQQLLKSDLNLEEKTSQRRLFSFFMDMNKHVDKVFEGLGYKLDPSKSSFEEFNKWKKKYK